MWHKNLSPNLKPLASTAPGLFVPLSRRHKVNALAIALSVMILMAGVRVGNGKVLLHEAGSLRFAFAAQEAQKRIVMLRHNDTAEGSRCTITSDSLLDDYISYVEGERFLVRLPQSTLFNAHNNPTGRGFTDMRVEQNEGDVVISFLLQPRTSVSVNQSFNRLEINFLTNEAAKENEGAK